MGKGQKRLNPNHLGAKGEAKFRELCEDAQLICNKSDRDLAGWDFIVSFPFPVQVQTKPALDARKAPASCHVQVKTLWQSSETINWRLSSAELLAKEPKPSFIYVLKVSDDLRPVEAFLIHLLDDPLGAILRSLRQARAGGHISPNKKMISMSVPKYGVRLAPTGDALRNALLEQCGEDQQKYITKKNRQLEKLGFERDAMKVSATFSFKSNDEFLDAMLGLVPEIKAKDFKVTERRFGIEIPIASYKESTIRIEPQPADSCTITVRSSEFVTPGILKAKVYFPAVSNLSLENLRMRIEGALFKLLVTRNSFNVTTDAGRERHKISEWQAFWKFAYVLISGDGTFEIKSDKGPWRLNPVTDVAGDEKAISEARYLRAASEGAQRLIHLAGVVEEPEITNAQLRHLKDQLLLVGKMTAVHDLDVEIVLAGVTSTGTLVDGAEEELAFIGYIPFGEVVIGYCSIVTLKIIVTPEGFQGKSVGWRMKEARVLDGFPSSYSKWINAASGLCKLPGYFAIPLPDSLAVK